jgi:hypothetical protein
VAPALTFSFFFPGSDAHIDWGVTTSFLAIARTIANSELETLGLDSSSKKGPAASHAGEKGLKGT